MCRIRLCVIISCLFATACDPQVKMVPNYMSDVEVPEYPPYTGEVGVLYQYPPPGTFVEIGTTRAQGMVWDSKLGMVEHLQKAAATMGGNFIIVSPKVHDGFFTTVFNRGRLANAEAIVIRVERPQLIAPVAKPAAPSEAEKARVPRIPPEMFQERGVPKSTTSRIGTSNAK